MNILPQRERDRERQRERERERDRERESEKEREREKDFWMKLIPNNSCLMTFQILIWLSTDLSAGYLEI